MSRGASGAMQTAAAAGIVYPILFAYFDMSGGALRVCTNNQAVSWNGYTWTGLGDFGHVSPVKESNSTQANGLTFGLSGIPSALITEVIGLRSRGRTCTLWLGLYNAAGTLQADPIQLFSGLMDQPTVSDSGDKSDVSITAESRLVKLGRSRERRYTEEDQKSEYPTDLGCDFVASLQEKEIIWGKASTTTTAPARGGYNSESYKQYLE